MTVAIAYKKTRGKEEIWHEDDLSAQEAAEKQRTRVQKKNEHEERKERTEEKKVKGKKGAFRIKAAFRGLFANGNLQEVDEC